MLWELLCWELPWSTHGAWQVVGQLINGRRPAVPPRPELPGLGGGGGAGLDAYLALMRRCWAQQPDERPPFEEVVPELRCVAVGPVAAVGQRRQGRCCAASPRAPRPAAARALLDATPEAT